MAICIRTAGYVGAALPTMAGMHEARAQSAGCSAAVQQLEQAGFNGSVGAGQSQSSAPIAFTAGDTLIFYITINNYGPGSGSWVLAGSNPTQSINTGGSFTVTYTVMVSGETLTETITGQASESASRGSTTVSVTCRSNNAQKSTTDSQKLAAVQTQGSRVVGQTSGAAITGAVNGAVADGLSGGKSGAPASGSAPPFGIGAGSEQMSRLGAFASPRNEGSSQGEWRPWATVLGSGWELDDRNPNADSIKGNQINATFGAGRLLMPGVLVGVVGGYENFKYEFDSLNGRLQGNGWTVGAYGGWAFAHNLRFDVTGAWTGLSYDASAGTAVGSFKANRWLASTGLTGTYQMNAFIVEPSSRLYALWERQDAWSDSLGTGQTERSFSVGRVSTGAKVGYPWQAVGTTFVPYIGLYGDYRFSSDDALSVSQPFVGLSDGWSARVTTGAVMVFTGGRLSLEGELGSIGSGDRLWSLSVRGSIPFY
jgi:hypothetical protein